MFDKYTRAGVGKHARVDDTYRYVLRQGERVCLAIRTGYDGPSGIECEPELLQQFLDKWAEHVQMQIRTLNEGGVLGLLGLPDA